MALALDAASPRCKSGPPEDAPVTRQPADCYASPVSAVPLASDSAPAAAALDAVKSIGRNIASAGLWIVTIFLGSTFPCRPGQILGWEVNEAERVKKAKDEEAERLKKAKDKEAARDMKATRVAAEIRSQAQIRKEARSRQVERKKEPSVKAAATEAAGRKRRAEKGHQEWSARTR
ncbi:hypothetical protein BDZ91DRAFT_766511 [Kalaharituber pfeilii]|nr:hypothetical protein BDZ91DRAFT_766511 [Kalaharituber pfeilii]